MDMLAHFPAFTVLDVLFPAFEGGLVGKSDDKWDGAPDGTISLLHCLFSNEYNVFIGCEASY